MILTRLHLINFGKFTNHEVTFTGELNIFYGLNETGKTTIVDAIAGVLFGFGGRREDIRKLKARYIPRFNGSVYKAGLSAVIDSVGDIYIERDFLTNKAEVFTVHGGARNLSGFSANEIVSEALGVTNINLFRSTMLIRQEEMALLATTEITDVLSGKIISGDHAASVKSIFRALGQKYLELNRGLLRNVGKPGPIRQCLDEIKRLEGQLRSTEILEADYEDMLKKAGDLEQAILERQSRHRVITENISAFRKKQELLQQVANLLKRQEYIVTRMENFRQIQLELKEIERYLETKEPYSNLISEAVLNQISNLEIDIERLRERAKLNIQNLEYYRNLKEKLQNELLLEAAPIDDTSLQRYTMERLLEAQKLAGQISALNRQFQVNQNFDTAKGNKKRNKLFPLFFTGGLLSLLIAAGLFLKNGVLTVLAVWSLILLAVGLGLFISGLIMVKSGTPAGPGKHKGSAADGIIEAAAGYSQKLSEITGGQDLETFRTKVYSYEESRKRKFSLENQIAGIDLADFLEAEQQTNQKLEQCQRNLNHLLEQAGTSTPGGFRELYDSYWEARRRRDTLIKDAARCLEGKSEVELNKELADISGKIVNIRTETALITLDLTEEECNRQVKEEAALREQIKADEIELARIKTAIDDFRRFALHNQDRWDIENTLLEKKAELDALTLKKDGIAEAVKVLRDSLREVQSGTASNVGERASGIISVITDRKYKHIEPNIKETEFNIAATLEGTSDQLSPGFLSSGTRDQVYLSMRLAIAEFLAGGRKFPLILDDPFIHFDEVRLENTIAFLKQAAEGHQVILVTKDPAFLKFQDSITVGFMQ